MRPSVLLLLSTLACRPDPTDGPTDPTGHTGDGGAFLPPPVAPTVEDGDVLVVPERSGLTLLRPDGSRAWARTWTEVVGACDACGGEGASVDGDGLLLSFTTEGPTRGGGVARLRADGGLDWRIDGFSFPHDAVRDPLDDTVIVPEVNGSTLLWIPGDGSSADPVRSLVRGEDPGWPGELPNGVQRFDAGGRRYVLVSHRGQSYTRPDRPDPTGVLTLWDITAEDASVVWTFPEDGALDVPHGAVFRVVDGRWWLLWAHSYGHPGGSTVGIAVTDDPTVRPAYVADLLPVGDAAPFDFLRGVELDADGTLWLVDSGPGNGVGTPDPRGRMLSAPLPTLPPAGEHSGAVLRDQVFVELTPTVHTTALGNPFEGWWWRPTWDLAAR